MPKLCLIDVSGYLHRAFHAIPPLTTSKGEPVNAIYGFTRMISKVLKEESPDFMALCFDTPAPTFRHEEYKPYKATRAEIDTSLLTQLPLAEELVKAWGLPCFKKEGFEADDLIATFAKRGQDAGMKVLVFTGDKDILQLVNDDIRVRDELKKVEYTEEKVVEKYGLKPHQLVDFFSLTGDKVDNVVGVPGVGEKTASRLLGTYGSLEGIFENMETSENGLSPSLKKKLLQSKDTALNNRRLIALRFDVPLPTTFDDFKIHGPQKEALTALVKRLEFKGGLYGVEEGDMGPVLNRNEKRHVRVVLSENDLKELDATLANVTSFAYDLETDGLDVRTCHVVGVSLSTQEDKAWYIPVGHSYMGMPDQLPWPRVKDILKPHLESRRVLKIGQNLKFDNAILLIAGIETQEPTFDTMVAAYCADPSRKSFGLKDMAADYLGEQMTRIQELIGKTETFVSVEIEQAAAYAGADAEVTFRLMKLLKQKLEEKGLVKLFEDLEMPLVEILRDMELMGVAVDVVHLHKVREKFDGLKKALEQEIFNLAGEEFVLNSPKQMSRILFEKLKLPVIRKTKTGASTDEEVLIKLASQHPICEKIIAHRELAKLSSTYVTSLLELADKKTGRVHTTFHQTGTVTGRVSSTDPNLQNIPIRTENGREIRRSFIAAPGCALLSADYSQIDLRSLAHMSDDPVLVKAFREGGDVHAATAAEIFHVSREEVTPDMRRSAKAINFGVVYGQQAYALSQSLGIPIETGREFINRYFEKYAGVKDWIQSTLAEARKTGFVSTLSGRRREVPDITSANSFTRGFAERVAINTPIQGTSADIIKAAMIRIHQELKKQGFQTKMLLQVHDELVFEVPENETDTVMRLIKENMEQAFELRVPLIADLKRGPNWCDMKKVDRGGIR